MDLLESLPGFLEGSVLEFELGFAVEGPLGRVADGRVDVAVKKKEGRWRRGQRGREGGDDASRTGRGRETDARAMGKSVDESK